MEASPFLGSESGSSRRETPPVNAGAGTSDGEAGVLEQVLDLLSAHEVDPDTLALHLGMDIREAHTVLSTLEIQGVLKRDAAGCYHLIERIR